MLIFASSDKGGSCRSVTGCNIAYRLAEQGLDVAYLDFDFGSPTAGAIFEIPSCERGVVGGVHSYFRKRKAAPARLDVYERSVHVGLGGQPAGFGKLVLLPGDQNGADFGSTESFVEAAAWLFEDLEREFDACVVDLRSGRSDAVDLALRALATEPLRNRNPAIRWLVFHRWTRQHVLAAHGLVFEPHGILTIAEDAGHRPDEFLRLVRTVRTAVPDLNTLSGVGHPPQARWLRASEEELVTLATERGLGMSRVLGMTPLEPMLQWREQVILDVDVHKQIAKEETVTAFRHLARALSDTEIWEND